MTLNVFRSLKPLSYSRTLDLQRKLHVARVSGIIGDTLWLLEHLPVITTGLRHEQKASILVDPAAVGAEFAETDRGGEVTYHGPGQLVGYLFVDIGGFYFRVRNFVRLLEETFIRYLADHHAVTAGRDSLHPGVWVKNEKITAIGLALKKRVTLHGFAFNVNTDLSHFQWIVPCGIPDKGVTSLEKITGSRQDMDHVSGDVADALRQTLGYESLSWAPELVPQSLA